MNDLYTDTHIFNILQTFLIIEDIFTHIDSWLSIIPLSQNAEKIDRLCL